MDAASEMQELSCQKSAAAQRTSGTSAPKKQKLTKHVQTVTTVSSSSDDEIPLSQIALTLKKKIAPFTPNKTDRGKGKAIRIQTEEEIQELPKKKRKLQRQLQYDDVEDVESTIPSEDHEAKRKQVLESPYSLYQPLIGQATDLRLYMYRWWQGKLYGENSPVSVVFIAIDSEGYKIQGYMPPFLARKFNDPIQEGLVYDISTIQVVQANKQTQMIDAPVQLQAIEQTTFQFVQDDSFQPQLPVTLTRLCILPTLPPGYSILRDMVAVVIDIRPQVTRPARGKNGLIQFAEAFITDDTIYPKCMVLTVWKDAVDRYQIFNNDFARPFIIEATGLKPNTYRGNYGFQTTTFTRLEFPKSHSKSAGQMLRRIVSFKPTAIYPTFDQQTFSEIMTQDKQKIHTIAEFLNISAKKPMGNEVFLYTVTASIIHIYSELAITYRSCILCKKGMPDQAGDSYGCPNKSCLNREGKTTYRYRLRVAIKDSSGRIDIVIFGEDAEELLRTPANTVQAMLSEDDGLSKIQDLFRSAYNKVHRFGFRINSSNFEYVEREQYTVHQIEWVPKSFDDPEILLSQPDRTMPASSVSPSASPVVMTSRHKKRRRRVPVSSSSSSQSSSSVSETCKKRRYSR